MMARPARPPLPSKEVDEKELVAAIEQHGLLFLQKPVMASIAARQFSAAFAPPAFGSQPELLARGWLSIFESLEKIA